MEIPKNVNEILQEVVVDDKKIDGIVWSHRHFVGIRLCHGLHGMFYQVDCSTSCQLPCFVLPIA